MVWVFGDSYSANFDHEMMGPFAKKYIDYMGRVPKNFGHFLSEHLNCDSNNLAVPGNNNDAIFEAVIKNAPLIQKHDVIVIGWSDIVRFRMAKTEGGKSFKQVIPGMPEPEKFIENVSRKTTHEILVNRMSSAYYEEFKIRFEFLNWLFRDNILIQWTCHESNIVNRDDFDILNFTKPNLNMVTDETSGVVIDNHYSETGHKQLTKLFIRLLEDDVLRKFNNSITTIGPDGIIALPKFKKLL